MAISEYKNGHIEKMAAWSQILQIVGNSTLFHLPFVTYDSPGSLLIKVQIYYRIWKYGKIFYSNVPVCDIYLNIIPYEVSLQCESLNVYANFACTTMFCHKDYMTTPSLENNFHSLFSIVQPILVIQR